MKRRGRPKDPVAVKLLSSDMLARIRRAEWVQERKEADAKHTRTTHKPQSCDDWRGIVQRMR